MKIDGQPMLKTSEPQFPFADAEVALFVGAASRLAANFGHWWGKSRKGHGEGSRGRR